jgi:hypothetical protein
MIWNITGPQIFSIIPLISKGMIDGAARLEEGIKAGESPQKLQALTLQIKKSRDGLQRARVARLNVGADGRKVAD